MNPFLKKKNEVVQKKLLGLTGKTNDAQQAKNESNNVENDSKDLETSAKPETFVSWFAKEKTSLENKNPNLTPSEITQMALKLYKSNNEKRKATEEAEGGKNKQQKLSVFAFNKNR